MSCPIPHAGGLIALDVTHSLAMTSATCRIQAALPAVGRTSGKGADRPPDLGTEQPAACPRLTVLRR